MSNDKDMQATIKLKEGNWRNRVPRQSKMSEYISPDEVKRILTGVDANAIENEDNSVDKFA